MKEVVKHDSYFYFIRSCIAELKSKAHETIAFSEEQVKELKQHFDLEVLERDYYYLLRLKGGDKRGRKQNKS